MHDNVMIARIERQLSLCTSNFKLAPNNILIFFQYNLVCFDFVQASSSKKLCLILFDSLYSETFDGNFVLCNTLYTGERGVVIYDCNSLLPTRVIALQVVRTSFLGPTPSYFPLPLLVSTLFMLLIMCHLQEVKLSLLCPEKIGFLLLVSGIMHQSISGRGDS